MEVYVEECALGGLDLYCRMVPKDSGYFFGHYWIDVSEPMRWMEAQKYEFVGRVEKPEWSYHPTSRRARL